MNRTFLFRFSSISCNVQCCKVRCQIFNLYSNLLSFWNVKITEARTHYFIMLINLYLVLLFAVNSRRSIKMAKYKIMLQTFHILDGTEPEFPRTRLKYIREVGKGWFGKVTLMQIIHIHLFLIQYSCRLLREQLRVWTVNVTLRNGPL